MKRILLSLVLLSLTVLFSCTAYAQTAGSNEKQEDYWYEAVFVDNDEITKLFTDVRGKEVPYAKLTKDFHVTTGFKVKPTHPEWYGKSVIVRITAYKAQEIEDDKGKITANEGFKVTISAVNSDLQKYLSSINKNFHITGSYKDEAKYTEKVDFSDGQPLDITLIGTFGCGYSDNTIDLGKSFCK